MEQEQQPAQPAQESPQSNSGPSESEQAALKMLVETGDLAPEEAGLAPEDTAEAPPEQSADAEPNESAEPPEDAAQADGAEEGAEADEQIAPRLAMLKRRDRLLSQREQQLKQREKQLEEQEAALRRLDDDPLAVLNERGISFNDLAERVLGELPGQQGASPADAKTLREQIRQEVLEEVRKELGQRDAKTTQQRIVEDYRRDIGTALAGEEFALLRTNPDAVEEVLQFAAANAREGIELTPEQAARTIQQEYREHLSSQLSHKAVRQALGLEANETTAPSDPKAKDTASPKGLQTLTNASTANPTRASQEDLDVLEMSEEEQMRWALNQAALQGK